MAASGRAEKDTVMKEGGGAERSGARMISQSNYYNLRKGNLDWDA